MATVFMTSLATVWVTMAFPVWVLVSGLLLARTGLFERLWPGGDLTD
jgi:hypothetical protein